MGSASSCLHSAVAPLNPSAADEDGDQGLLEKLASQPALLSKPVPGLSMLLGGVAQTWIHVACERKQVHVVKRMCQFLATSNLATVREALGPYCRRMGLPPPESPAEGLRLAVGMCNGRGQTPLMHACYAGCPELVKLLLDKGADPWASDRCGCRTALHYAAIAGSAGCVAALLQSEPAQSPSSYGVKYIDNRSLSGLTPLHYAVYYERHEVLRELLRHEPDINAATSCSSYDIWLDCEAASTPLHFAAARGNATAVQELLRYYASRRHTGEVPDPRLARNSSGRQPWHLAASQYPALRYLTVVLQPGQPLTRIVGGDDGSQTTSMGAPSLASIAAAALRRKLLASVVAAEAAAAAATAYSDLGSGKLATCRTAAAAAAAAEGSGSLPPPASPDTPPARSGQGPSSRLRLLRSPDGGGSAGGALPAETGAAAAAASAAPVADVAFERHSFTASGSQRSGSSRRLLPALWGGGSSGRSAAAAPVSSGSLPPPPLGSPVGAPSLLPPHLLAIQQVRSSLQETSSQHHPFGVQAADSYPEVEAAVVAAALGRSSEDSAADVATAMLLPPTASTSAAAAAAAAGSRSGGSLAARCRHSSLHLDVEGAAPMAAGAAAAAAAGQGLCLGPGTPTLHRCTTSPPVAGSRGPSGLLGSFCTTVRGCGPRGCSTQPPRIVHTVNGYFLDGGRGAEVAAGTADGAGSTAAAAAAAAAEAAAAARKDSDTEGVTGKHMTFEEAPVEVLRVGAGVLGMTRGSRGRQPCGGGAGDADDGDVPDTTCSVCFVRRKTVAPSGCGHGLCVACARELCHGLSARPLLCPFCRQAVTDFVPFSSPQPFATAAAAAAAGGPAATGSAACVRSVAAVPLPEHLRSPSRPPSPPGTLAVPLVARVRG